MRRAARTDANQAVIVGALRACGAQVQSLAAIGEGVPDLLVAHRGKLMLFEVKNPKQKPSDRRLTAAQRIWHESWPVTVVETCEGAIAALG